MSKKRKLETSFPDKKVTSAQLSTPCQTRENIFNNANKYQIKPYSPGFDTNTPHGKSIPQSQGPYCPPSKVQSEEIYHKQRLGKVPLKRVRGRKKLAVKEVPTEDTSLTEFDIKTCGYTNGKAETIGIFSMHRKISLGCECENFVRTLKAYGETWHYRAWWKESTGEDRYQFLYHHCCFHNKRLRRNERSRLPPCCFVNMRIPGVGITYTICREQFFRLVGVHSKNYTSTIRRIWHEQTELHKYTTHWKPTRKKDSKWFDFWRTKFAEWHTLEEGHYSKAARKGLVDSRKAFHIVRESGFDKLSDYWEEFIRKSPHLNPPNKVKTLDAMILYSAWKRGKRNKPAPEKASILKNDQPFPTLTTFRCVISRKLDMKRKAPISEQCAVCSSFLAWIHDAEKAGDKDNLQLLRSEYNKHKEIYDWARARINQSKESASQSYIGIFEINRKE